MSIVLKSFTLLARRRLPSTAESSTNNVRLEAKKNCTFRRHCQGGTVFSLTPPVQQLTLLQGVLSI